MPQGEARGRREKKKQLGARGGFIIYQLIRRGLGGGAGVEDTGSYYRTCSVEERERKGEAGQAEGESVHYCPEPRRGGGPGRGTFLPRRSRSRGLTNFGRPAASSVLACKDAARPSLGTSTSPAAASPKGRPACPSRCPPGASARKRSRCAAGLQERRGAQLRTS